jgi:parallel beta-helix repeat protein
MKHHTLKILLFICALNMQIAYAVDCGDYIATNVVLKSNLDCTSGYTALEVVNHNVTIDLNGFTLSGPREMSGIHASGYDNVVVKNGSIKGFWAGINSSRADQLNVNNVTFYEVGHGVIIHAGNKARIQDNDFIKTTSSAVTISVRVKSGTANQNLISRNEFYRAAGGISICGSHADKNVISDNLIWKSSDYGIHLNHSDRNQIYRNRILETIDATAMRLNNSSYNEVKDNTIREGGGTGISILGNAGGACFEDEFNSSVKNRFMSNQISEFNVAVNLGLGGFRPARNVEGNGLLDNRITDSNIGIRSQTDTRNNYGRGTVFTNTSTPVIDNGVNNQY